LVKELYKIDTEKWMVSKINNWYTYNGDFNIYGL